jgi:hypothetical protein
LPVDPDLILEAASTAHPFQQYSIISIHVV